MLRGRGIRRRRPAPIHLADLHGRATLRQLFAQQFATPDAAQYQDALPGDGAERGQRQQALGVRAPGRETHRR